MTNEQKEQYYKLLKQKHTQTNWNNLESIKEYNRYARELRKSYEENWN